MTRITHHRTHDLRARTSATLAGSDAVHGDPDYSAAYVVLYADDGIEGHGLTFTIGRGNDLCCAAIDQLAAFVVGRRLDDIVDDMAGFWRQLTNDTQLRWLGPEKGVIHLATAAVVNAVWDLWAKQRNVPVWQLVADLEPEQLVSCIDFRYLRDELDEEQALERLRSLAPTRVDRIAELRRDGYPAYVTSAGWLGYSEPDVRDLCRGFLADGWTSFKTKVGIDVVSDQRRCEIMREELGDDVSLMADANQVWTSPRPSTGRTSCNSSTCGGSRSQRAPTTYSATQPSELASPPLVSQLANTPITESCSSSCYKPKRSTTSRSTHAGSVA